MLYGYGLRVGTRALFHGRVDKPVIKRIILPVNYWRNLAFQFALAELQISPGDRVLDIGSPKLLSLFIAERLGALVYSTDRDPYFLSDYRDNRAWASFSTGKFYILRQDGRRLVFQDHSFSRVYSLSVIEHIPDDGDKKCFREVHRVLKRGGRFVSTVPFHPEGRIDYRSPDFYWGGSQNRNHINEPVFYQRRYSEDDLYQRLIEPSGLELKKIVFVGSALPEGKSAQISGCLAQIPGPIQLVLSRFLIRGPVKDWRNLKYPSAAYLLATKPLSD